MPDRPAPLTFTHPARDAARETPTVYAALFRAVRAGYPLPVPPPADPTIRRGSYAAHERQFPEARDGAPAPRRAHPAQQ
jgi:hypothetical protein